MFAWASLESGLVRSSFSFGCLCLLEALAWDFRSWSRSLRLALRSASCLCFVRLSGVVNFGSEPYLAATLAASRTAVRALLKPADAVTVSGASSSLSLSASDEVSLATCLKFSSSGDGSGLSTSSMPNFLCITFTAFWGRASASPGLETLSPECSPNVDDSSANPFGALFGDVSLICLLCGVGAIGAASFDT